MAIVPNRAQFEALAASTDAGPVVMLNLLKFRPAAQGEDGTGADDYRRYGDGAAKMVEAQGGRILWFGRAEQVLIGEPTDEWDAVALVEYPSRQAFVEMVTAPAYGDVHQHREAGLERTVLLACKAEGNR